MLQLRVCKVAGGDHVEAPETEVTPGETGLLQSGWDRGAIHIFCVVLFSPSHRDDIILVIYVEFGVGGGVVDGSQI